MSFEIINDSRSERFRDRIARAFVEILGQHLQYGPWSVMLRSEREVLSVVMTGPGETREEWAFDLDFADAHGPADIAAELRRRFRASDSTSPPKT